MVIPSFQLPRLDLTNTFDQYLSGEEVQQAQLTQLLMRMGLLPSDTRSDLVPPLPAGALGSILPKPKATFYGFGKPIDLSDYAGAKILQSANSKTLRQKVENSIDAEIKDLLLLRERRRHKRRFVATSTGPFNPVRYGATTGINP